MLVEHLRSAKNPALFYCNAFGDHVITRPTVLALQQCFDGRLSCIGAGQMPDLFFPDAAFCKIKRLLFTQTDTHDHNFSVAEAKHVCSEFDAIISLNPWHSSQVDELKQSICPSLFTGLAPELGLISDRAADQHMVDYTFQIAKLIDPSLRCEDFATLPPIPKIDQHRLNHLRSMLPSGKRVLAVHSWTKSFKTWPIENFRLLISTFLEQHTDFVAVIVDPIDLELDQNRHSERTFSLEGIDLLTATALVQSCDAFVGIDSYFLHVADVSNRPSVGLFGPTDPMQWGFRFAKRARHIANRNIQSITPKQVLDELNSILASELC